MSHFHAKDESIAELIGQLNQSDRLQRVHAAAALVRLGKQGFDVSARLIAALRTGTGTVQKMAALVLGDLAPLSRLAIPVLIEALADADEGLRRRAVVALGQFGREARAAVPALRARRNDKDEGVRSFAATALALIEPDTEEAA